MFDLQCKTCQYVFEDLLGADEPLPVCPDCGSIDTTKLMGAPGTLWYCFTPNMLAGVRKAGDSSNWPYKVKTKEGTIE